MAFLKQMALGAVISVDLSNQSLTNLGQLTRGLNQAEKGLTGLVHGGARVGAAVFSQVALAGAFAAGGIAAVVYQSAEFDKAMHGVASVSATSAEEMQNLRQGALGLAGAFSPTEIAGAMEEMRRAGFSVQDTIRGISTVSNVAQADEMSLAEATTIVGNVWRAFGGDISHVGDVVVRASADTATNAQRLGLGLAYVGPVAKMLGITVEETAAALGQLAQRGLDGQKGGRGLSTVLLRLLKPTKEMAPALEKMGFAWSLNADGSVNMAESLRTLQKGFSGLKNNVERGAMSSLIFGKDQSKAGANLIDMVDEIERETVALQNANGAAEEMAKARLDTPIGQWTILTNKAKAFAIMLGESTLPALMIGLHEMIDIVDQLTDGFNGVGDSFMNNVGRGMKLAVDDINVGLTYMKLILDSVADTLDDRFKGISDSLGVMTGYFAVLGTVGLAVFGPFAGVLAVALYFLSGLGEAAVWIVAIIAIGLVGAMAAFGSLVSVAMANGMGLFEFVSYWVESAAYYFGIFYTGFMEVVSGLGSNLGPALTLLYYSFLNIGEGIMTMFNLITSPGTNFGETMAYELGRAAGWFVRLLALIAEMVAALIFLGSLFYRYVAAPIAGVLMGLMSVFTLFIAGVFDFLMTKIDQMIAGSGIFKWGLEKLGLTWEKPDLGVGDAVEDFKAKINGVMDVAMEADAKAKAGAAAAADTPPPVQVNDNRCLHVNTKVELDGKNLTKGIQQYQVEMTERAGFSITPWQKRAVLEQGAVTISQK